MKGGPSRGLARTKQRPPSALFQSSLHPPYPLLESSLHPPYPLLPADWLDGYVAKSWQAQSTFGSYLDPLADKVPDWGGGGGEVGVNVQWGVGALAGLGLA